MNTDADTKYNYYDILEVSSHCPQHEITTAYERAKSTYSVDNPAIYTMFNQEEARELLKMVEEAYLVLGNKILRTLYDEKIGQQKPLSSLTFESLQAESKSLFSETPKKSVQANSEKYKVDADFENEIINKTDWSGEDLKKVREYKKITIEKMSDTTKISSYYIQAIEKIDVKNLPAYVFVRGYVSQISKNLGLDEKKVCDSYMKYFKAALDKK